MTASITTALPWGRLLLLATAAFWAVTLEMLPTGLLPVMTEDLGVEPARIGLLVTAWALTVAVSTLPLVRLTRRVDRRLLLVTALAAIGVATLISAWTPGYPGVMIGRILAAAAHGVAWSVLLVVAASLAPGREGRALAVVLAGPTLATAVGLPLATALGDAFGWRPVVGAVGAGLIVIGAVSLIGLDAMAASALAPAASRDASAWRVVRTAALGALALTGHFVAFAFVAPLATERWGLDDASLAPLLLVFGGAGAVGLLVAGWLGDRVARPTLVGSIAALALVLAGLQVAGAAAAVVLVALWGLLIGLLPPLLQAAVLAAASPTYRDTAGAVLVTTFNLGVAAGALGGAVLIDLFGPVALLPVGAGAAAVSAVGLAREVRTR